jgi:hypothetical protein
MLQQQQRQGVEHKAANEVCSCVICNTLRGAKENCISADYVASRQTEDAAAAGNNPVDNLPSPSSLVAACAPVQTCQCEAGCAQQGKCANVVTGCPTGIV